MSNIVGLSWVLEHLHDPKVAIADCRFLLGQPNAGRKAYEAGHIPGALYWDLEQDLSGPAGKHGGRHPLPDLGVFAIKLGKAGIGNDTTVVAYDDQMGAMASRFWWLLTFLGHERVYVMDEGFTKWKEKGYPVTTEIAKPEPVAFHPNVRSEKLLSVGEVRERLGRPGTVLIDSREPRRYLGIEEPIDRVAGHIPGARNLFWKEVLDEQGRWLKSEALAEHFAAVAPDKDGEVVVYCGSGVTACPNILALTEAGYTNVKLYGGSWSDWISYEENPVATGEE